MAEKRLALATLLALSVSLMVVLTALAGPSQSNGFPVASELSQRQLWDDSKHIDLYSAKVSDAPTFDRYYKVDDREPRSIAQAQITVTPQELPATLVRGSTTTETLTIDNLGDADLDWNMAENPPRPWLREAPTSGAVTPGGSAAVVVTFTTPSLAGVYTTTLRITSDDPDTPQVNVPVTLTVLAPQIEVTPPEIAVTLGRSAVATETLTIGNEGDADLNWNLAENPSVPWLREAPPNGTVPPGGEVGVVVTFTAPSAVGVYTTSLRVGSNDPGGPVNLPITLTVTAASDIEVNPPDIAITLGRLSIATETLTISNTGDAILNWNLAEAPPAPWLVEAPINGTVPPGGEVGVVVTFTAPSAVGVYTTNLRINNNDPDEPQVYVPVTLTVVAADIEVNPSALEVMLNVGRSSTETLTISNLGDAALNWNLAEAPPRPWLAEAPNNGVVAPDGSVDVTVAFIAPPVEGIYTTTLRINSNDPDEARVNVPVTLTVVIAPDIEVSPSALMTTLDWGGTGTETLTISNTGEAELEWELVESPAASWLSESPTTGAITYPGSVDVVLTFDAEALAAGVYTTTLRIESDDPDEPQVDVPVTLTVMAPDIEVEPSNFSITLYAGETAVDALNISNAGNADLNWSLSESPASGWLSEAPVEGVVAPLGSTDVVVTFTTSSLSAGVYTTTLCISSDDPDEAQVDVSVTLTVHSRVYLPLLMRGYSGS